MKRNLTCLLILLFTGMKSVAEEGASKCVSTDSDVVFMVKDVVESGADGAKRYPVVKIADTGHPTGLEWVVKEAGTLSESEKIAEIGGKEIRRFVFWKEAGNKNGDGIVCVWFGIQKTAPSGLLGFRPFLVFSGDDQIRWWESCLSYDDGDGFTVHLSETLKGNGGMSGLVIVGFNNGEPVPLRMESWDRKREERQIQKFR